MDTLEHELNAAIVQLRKANATARIVKLRIFVAAGNDAGTLGGAVAANFREAHEPLPVVNIIEVGALEGGARVLAESVAEGKTDANPNGLAFISGQLTQTPKGGGGLLASVTPLAEKSVAAIQSCPHGELARKTPWDVIRVDCFTSSLGDRARVRSLVAMAFPRASVGLVQLEQSAAGNEVECESVARLKNKPAEPLVLINPTNAQFAQMALVSAPQVIFTSTATGGPDDAGIRQMFTSLKATASRRPAVRLRASCTLPASRRIPPWCRSSAICAGNSWIRRTLPPAPIWSSKEFCRPVPAQAWMSSPCRTNQPSTSSAPCISDAA